VIEMQNKPQPPNAAEAARRFWAHPEMQLEHEVAIRRTPAPAAQPVVVVQPRVSRQMQAAVSGRPVKALPTRAVRKAKRRAVRFGRRLALAGALAFVALALMTLVGLSPLIGVTMSLAVATIVLGWQQ
jgi:hypothetical protein